jgi:pullulanase/glycogen debranching enzyme
MGTDATQIDKFKAMVKAFHKENIAVIMDVVFNHLSEYELGNLKQIDKRYYFRLDEKGDFIARSYCGNDLATERPMVRRLIVESVLYWMKEYHIDGFRFDLAKLIDWGTIDAITQAAKEVNPDVLLIAEPWGGGYDPQGFSEHGWAAWNDQIRNGVKGQNPRDGLSWIFGKWFGDNNKDRLFSYLRGTLKRDKGGLFVTPAHSVNYLESHDDNTLGDFIRIGSGEVKENEKITDLTENAKVRGTQLRLNKLAALFLFVSRGITMIHEGQEFARSKVIVPQDGVNDENVMKIDHNSYNKDNATNYINFDYADLNSELVDYYKGLIKMRKRHEAFRRATYDDLTPINIDENDFAIAFTLNYKNEKFLVVLNGDREKSVKLKLPEGDWLEIVNAEKVELNNPAVKRSALEVAPSAGAVLKLREIENEK